MNQFDRREMLFAGVAVGALPAAALAAPAALGQTRGPTALDPLASVDPELRPIAQKIMSAMANIPPLSDQTLPMMRKGFPALQQQPLPTPAFDRRVIKGPRDNQDLVVYVINAKAGARRGGILHTHGGGFVTGSAKDGIRPLQETAAALDCAIVTVEYRLAPETTYKGSIEDNYAALRWLHAHGAELGVDPVRIAVMGESAGGGHAALLAITARDRGEVPVAFQCLVYPMLDDRTASSRPVPPTMGQMIWKPEANRYGWRGFLGGQPGGATAPQGAVPARIANLGGLPPAWIGVGGIDLFASEDIDYARRLLEAGVPTELLVVPGAFHGFDGIAPQTGVASRFNASKLAALKRALTA